MTTDELKRVKELCELLGGSVRVRRSPRVALKSACRDPEWVIYVDDFCKLLSGTADVDGKVKAACDLLTFAPLLVDEVERLKEALTEAHDEARVAAELHDL